MKYCTNCGKESNKNICDKCGVKQNTNHKFCGWCGEGLLDNAYRCPQCHEKVQDNKLVKFLNKICKIPIAIYAIFILLCLLQIKDVIEKIGVIKLGLSVIIVVVSILLITNSLDRYLQSKFKKGIASIIQIVKIPIIILLLVLGVSIPATKKEETQTVYERACENALDVFHENVRLKNESSFQLNGYSGQLFEEYKGQENLTLYRITIKYSAQNGLGGYGNDTYTVDLEYDSNSDEFKILDAFE